MDGTAARGEGVTLSTYDIRVAEDFHSAPLGRVTEDGPFNGTRFRREHLIPALKEHQRVRIILDGAMMGSSFLEESFGGLARDNVTLQDVGRIELVSEEIPSYVEEIREYIHDAFGALPASWTR